MTLGFHASCGLAARVCAAAIFALLCVQPATAQPVKGQVQVSTTNGFARIVVQLAEEVESEVKVAGGIIVILFKRPVDLPVETVAAGAPGYVGVARRDPDGMGVRLALTRKVNVNSMAAGERLFIDLLPDTWSGMAPGLPQEVIEDLARRAREAERQLRAQKQVAQKRKPVLTKVRVATQPTFTRYIFELPEVIAVTSDRARESLTLTFAASLNFDLTDARMTLPAAVRSIDAETGQESIAVRFALAGKVDVRSFREENSYVVDIGAADQKEVSEPQPKSAADAGKVAAPLPGLEAPQTVPARGAALPASAPPAPVFAPAKIESKIEPKIENKIESKIEPKPEPKIEPKPEPAAAVTPPPAAPAMPEIKPQQRSDSVARDPAMVAAELGRQGDNVRLTFPFAQPVAAAMFRRADALWLVFDSATPIDLSALASDTSQTIRSAAVTATREGQIVRIVLERPRLISAASEGPAWTVTIGDAVMEPTRPVGIARNMVAPARASITVPFDAPKSLHRLADPDIGDQLLVVTALGPARGFLKSQDFVEFRALASTHGIAVQPLADDVTADLTPDKVVIGRPGGLTISGAAVASKNSAAFRPLVFDAQLWGFDRQSNFTERQYKLIGAAADAAEGRRAPPRLELARFYLAQDMFSEAKAVLDVALTDDRPTADDPTALVLRAIANIMIGRPDAALKDLADPLIGNQHDAPLWRAFALARQGKWTEASKGFKNVEATIATLPVELQRLALKEALRATIEVRDFAGADSELHEFETIGIPKQMEASVLVLTGRLAQGLGKNEDALRNFRQASESTNRPAASEARMREIALRYGLGDLKRADVIAELETLTTLWRGDDTEIEALQLLARLYTEEGRYRDAFYVMRTALKAHPNSELTLRIHNEAVESFDSLFLAGKGDALPAIDALSLFYDFRELTPIGRRGDEMIRRLADRLVSVDLLFQASELLAHQIENRLQGAARSQVATRLAVIYLMDRKPEKAQAILKSTRMAGLTNDLRQLRLLLEARALSDIGRHDLAVEAIANIDRREAIRLRSDIYWSAKRWQQAAEQLELLYGDRWRDFDPLSDGERADILRAAMGYALAEDSLGLGRLRERYAGKMADSPDRQAFEIASAPFGSNAQEFRELAKTVAVSDTLDTFLREMRAGYPEIGAWSMIDKAPPVRAAKGEARADPASTASVPRALSARTAAR